MVVAFVLMGCFAQQPLLFILGFAFWLGVCVAGMTLLRHFRASGTVVAGYDRLATYGAMQHPELTFEHVIGRGSTVAIGVLCLSLVSMLLGTRDVHAKLEALVTRITADVARVIAAQRNGLAAARRRQAARAVRRHLRHRRSARARQGRIGRSRAARGRRAARMASLFGALVGGTPPLPADSPGAQAVASLQPRLAAAWQAAADALGEGPAVAHALARLADARESLRVALDGIALGDPRDEAALLIAGERLIEQIDDYCAALDGLVELQRPRPGYRPARVRFHRDTGRPCATACARPARSRSPVRSGSSPAGTRRHDAARRRAVLRAARDRRQPGRRRAGIHQGHGAGRAGRSRARSASCRASKAFRCWSSRSRCSDARHLCDERAKTALAAAYLVAFNTLTGATNPFRPDVALFLNQSVAWVLATFLTLLTFRLILPRNLATDATRLRRTIRDDTLAVVAGSASWRRAGSSASSTASRSSARCSPASRPR